MSWIGAERANLEDRRAWIDEQIEALAEVEAALMGYVELAGWTIRRRYRLAAERPWTPWSRLQPTRECTFVNNSKRSVAWPLLL